MRILVFQHERIEHPGIFRHLLAEDGHEYVAVELDEGEEIPSLDGFDALWVMGGPMDVWQEDLFPWLIEEKRVIREAVLERGLPYLGICLGHQLLAEALGGEVGLVEMPEIGVMDVQLTEAGATGVFFDGLDEVFPCFQWHHAEVKRLPEGAQVLATSPACAVQAMRWNTRAFSTQFHMEVEADTVMNWAEIPGCVESLEAAKGTGALEWFDKAARARMPKLNDIAERVYINWMQTSAQI